MSVDTAECIAISTTLQQRRKAAIFNTHVPRLSLVSPYPTFTPSQLDMRRKVEILKYSNSASNTKTNNLTKNQRWSNLAKFSNVSNYAKATAQSSSTCPTLTTACNVPGPPMILQLDPKIPLYNYTPVLNYRTYGISPGNNIQLRLFTINELSIMSSDDAYIQEDTIDAMGNFVYTALLGSLAFTNFAEPDNVFIVPKFGVPMGLFASLIVGCQSIDDTGADIVKSPITDLSNSSIVITISDVKVKILYNHIEFTPIHPATCSTSYASMTIPCAQFQNILSGSYYAIQYVGMLLVDGLIVPSAQNVVYDVEIIVTYTTSIHNYDINNYFNSFSGGVFANLSSANANVSSDSTMFNALPNSAGMYYSGSFSSLISTF